MPIKNHALFLQVARKIVDIRNDVAFLITGDGERREMLERMVEELDLTGHVRFLGWRRDLDAIYADLDVVALTSLNEGTPVTCPGNFLLGAGVRETSPRCCARCQGSETHEKRNTKEKEPTVWTCTSNR